ncbi:MAG: glycosyltransferase family 2 protein [Oscillospiraceae bacterium]|nr:glycosyltransferase family 2 protein [Oscillospiraceae bacterium]
MKKVSIIIPVYNMESCVESGMKCVTEQTYKNLEIIVIDDGSKDKSYLKCLAEADKDRRIAVFSKNNEGSGAARNFGIRKATGDYVYFFDIDDYLEKNAVETLVTAMERENVDLVACSFSMYDGEKVFRTINKTDGLKRTGDEARKDYREQLFMYGENGIQGAAWYKLYKMDLIRKHNIRFPDLRKSQDDVFVARYVNYINGFYIVGDVLCRYTVNTYKKFWDKYRFDIFDTARGSTMYIKDIVCAWNEDNIEARNRIFEDYFHKTFGSFCFLFNPNLKLSPKKRLERIKEITDIFLEDIPKDNFSVNHKVFELMKKRSYKRIYFRIFLHIMRHKFD